MRFFIGIPCYRECERLSATIESITKNTVTPCEFVAYICPQSVVGNRNELLKQAKAYNADYVCMSDDDVDFTPGWDEKLLARMEPGIGQTAPLLLNPDGTVFTAWIDFHPGFIPYQVGCKGQVLPEMRECYYAPGVCGCVSIFSKDFLDSVGWKFDDQYTGSQFEDVDQTLTVRKNGFNVLYNGEVSLTHHQQNDTPRHNVENYEKLEKKWAQWVEDN